MKKSVKVKDKKDFLWWGRVVSFGIMILTFISAIYIINPMFFEILRKYGVDVFTTIIFVLATISILSAIFTIVVSIIYLRKFKKKVFSIVVFIISLLIILRWMAYYLSEIIVKA